MGAASRRAAARTGRRAASSQDGTFRGCALSRPARYRTVDRTRRGGGTRTDGGARRRGLLLRCGLLLSAARQDLCGSLGAGEEPRLPSWRGGSAAARGIARVNLADVHVARADAGEALRAARALSVDWRREWLEHLVEAPDGAAFVATRDGDVLGLALGYRRGEAWTLAQLAVREGLRGEGLGGALLAAAIAPYEACERTAAVPATACDALSLAARRAMVPQGALLELSGSMPGERTLAEIAAGTYHFTTAPILVERGRVSPAIGTLDRETRGAPRERDYPWFAEHGSGVLFSLAGEVVGYVFVWPDGTVGPLAAASTSYLTQMLAFALHAAATAYRASWIRLLVPGACGRGLRLLLRHGLRVGAAWWWCAESAPADLSRYVAFRPEAP
ncbi:GNAT family N-acetyltransferase [bacterium]|nr:MAG: GNAT family N-acetyltransferase [bacterium]